MSAAMPHTVGIDAFRIPSTPNFRLQFSSPGSAELLKVHVIDDARTSICVRVPIEGNIPIPLCDVFFIADAYILHSDAFNHRHLELVDSFNVVHKRHLIRLI
jgi:hypothetical protein